MALPADCTLHNGCLTIGESADSFAGAEYLEANQALGGLYFLEGSISCDAAREFARILPLSNIHYLIFSGVDIDTKGMLAIVESWPRCKLRSVSILTRVGFCVSAAIAKVLPKTAISDLCFAGADIHVKGACAIAKAMGKSDVATLYIANDNIGNGGAIAIARAIKSVQNLTLRGVAIGDPGAVAIATALTKCNCQTLDLSENMISDEGVEQLMIALVNCNLCELHLSDNRIGDRGASAISEALPSCDLDVLCLGYNRISNIGAVAIAEALPYCDLRRLDLNQNNIRVDDDLAALLGIGKDDILRIVGNDGGPIRDSL